MHSESLDMPTAPARDVVLHGAEERTSNGKRLALISLLCVLLSSGLNHVLARWLGVSRISPWSHADATYRRIGPRSGPQVFCAGSSLLVSGISWPEVSESLGQGVENWTVAGSSPEVWEVFQRQRRISNTSIIGVSVYDLNEMRLTPDRASYVPIGATISDFWSLHIAPDLRRRILDQYAIAYIRVLYPLAGNADNVLVRLRTKAADLLGQEAALQQHEGVVIERAGVLDVEDTMTSLSEWSPARVLRRTEVLREDNHGAHVFTNGPKGLAFRRVLLRARQQGSVIVVVLPVSPRYADAFLNRASCAAFEKALASYLAAVPQATVIRLDKIPGISDDQYFLDLVHLNAAGRRRTTEVFLQEMNRSRAITTVRSAR
jgi:hypothetical protein